MHHLDLGLFNYQIEYIREYLKNIHGISLVNEMDRRLSKIPRFSGLKIFLHEIQIITCFTVKEYKELIKVIVFIIDNLYNDIMQNKEYFVKNKKLVKLYEI